MRRARVAFAAGVPVAAGASWLAARRLDRRRLLRDPEYDRISPLHGRTVPVTGVLGQLAAARSSSSSPVTASAGSTGIGPPATSASRSSA
jgi:hypothetical protein